MTTTKNRKKVLLILLSFSEIDDNPSRNVPADLMGGITYPHLSHHWQKEWGHRNGLKPAVFIQGDFFSPPQDIFGAIIVCVCVCVCVCEGISRMLLASSR